MNIVPATKAYEETVHSWWRAQDWPVIPFEQLPSTGFIATRDMAPLAACWVYQTNAPTWMLEWIVGNPNIDAELRSEGLDALLEHVIEWSKERGANTLFTMTKHPKLLARLEKHGYFVTDKEMTHLVRRLN